MAASFTVFVCSTFSDLSQEREGVLDAIRRLKLQHDSMEFFGARAEQPIETCLQEVRASDMLVVIVGHRYGSIVPDLGISYSEAEYAEGFRLKKPCLVYIRDDNVPILPRHMERDPEKLKLLERWKEALQSRHTVSTFQDGGRLAVQVAADLARTIQNFEPPTIVNKATNVNTGYSAAALAIAKIFVERTSRAVDGDPQITVAELQKVSGLLRDDFVDALKELSDKVEVAPDAIWPKDELFASFDQCWKEWNPTEDARRLAADLVNDKGFPRILSEIAERYGWDARRLNPTVAYLRNHGLVSANRVAGAQPWLTLGIEDTEETRHFVRSRP